MTDYIIKTFNIIEALQANLDIVNGGEDAQFLNRFYNVIFSSLTMATAKVEPEKEFNDIIAYIQQVHDRWYNMAYPHRVAVGSELPVGTAQMAAQQAQVSASPAE
jgi:flagellin-specific chaperone FliS